MSNERKQLRTNITYKDNEIKHSMITNKYKFVYNQRRKRMEILFYDNILNSINKMNKDFMNKENNKTISNEDEDDDERAKEERINDFIDGCESDNNCLNEMDNYHCPFCSQTIQLFDNYATCERLCFSLKIPREEFIKLYNENQIIENLVYCDKEDNNQSDLNDDEDMIVFHSDNKNDNMDIIG